MPEVRGRQECSGDEPGRNEAKRREGGREGERTWMTDDEQRMKMTVKERAATESIEAKTIAEATTGTAATESIEAKTTAEATGTAAAEDEKSRPCGGPALFADGNGRGEKNGGPCRNRTCNPLIKSQVLCQLS